MCVVMKNVHNFEHELLLILILIGCTKEFMGKNTNKFLPINFSILLLLCGYCSDLRNNVIYNSRKIILILNWIARGI